MYSSVGYKVDYKNKFKHKKRAPGFSGSFFSRSVIIFDILMENLRENNIL